MECEVAMTKKQENMLNELLNLGDGLTDEEINFITSIDFVRTQLSSHSKSGFSLKWADAPGSLSTAQISKIESIWQRVFG